MNNDLENLLEAIATTMIESKFCKGNDCTNCNFSEVCDNILSFKQSTEYDYED